MDQVSIEAAESLSGEEAFILQLRPPAPPGADEAALANRIDEFTRLYLTGAQPRYARFAQLAPLTWAIAAPRREAELVEQVRIDLCETLFGSDNPARIELARQPGEDEDRFEHPSAASRAAFDDDAEVFDLDAAALNLDDTDVFEVDAWRLPDAAISDDEAAPLDNADAPDGLNDHGGQSGDASADGDLDGLDWMLDGPDPVTAGDDDGGEADVRNALAELERAFAEDGGVENRSFEDDFEPPAETAPESFDLDDDFNVSRFEADLDAFEATARDAHGGLDEPGDYPRPDPDQLTEAPAPRAGDVAAELAAFRAEMRTIAESIHGAGTSEALARFREEMDAVAGAMGQRVDGAAQRIEAAADRILSAGAPDASERMNGAAERAEQSAALMESSVQDAVRALKAVLEAASLDDRPAATGG